VRHYLRDPTFSRFDTIPECDRQTDRQTHDHGIYRATLSIASRGEIGPADPMIIEIIIGLQEIILARDVIYRPTSRAYATMPVRLSVCS